MKNNTRYGHVYNSKCNLLVIGGGQHSLVVELLKRRLSPKLICTTAVALLEV